MNLKIENLSKKIKNTFVFQGLSLESDAQVIGLIGPSGSGKSSLLRLLAGIDLPSEGRIYIDHLPLPITEGKDLQNFRKTLGVVFQSWNLFPHMTARQNILFPQIRVHGMTKEAAEEKTSELLCRFALSPHENKRPSQLSGGQNQRVAIVRAIAHNPKILLLDEPTSALDPVMTAEVLDILSELKDKGSRFVIASHHLPFLKGVADEVVFMSEGKVLEHKKSAEFFRSPSSEVAAKYLSTLRKYQ